MSVRAVTVIVVLAGILLVLLPPVRAVPIDGYTCVFPGLDCLDKITSMRNGGFAPGTSPYDGKEQTCKDRGGTPYPDTLQNIINQGGICYTTCCCGPQISSIIASTTCPTGTTGQPQIAGDTSCQQTCNPTTPTPPVCGQRTLVAADVDVCTCGPAYVSSAGVGKFCCWNGVIADTQALCPTPPANTCTPNANVPSSGCVCGADTKTTGFCCAGGVWKDSSLDCPAAPPPVSLCGNDKLDSGEACDAKYQYVTSPPGWKATSGVGCNDAAKYCSNTCQCVTTPGVSACVVNGVCDTPVENPTNCAADCAQQTCALHPTLSGAKAEYTNSNVVLTWQAPTGCTVTNYQIVRSVVNAATALTKPDNAQTILPNTALTYTDNTVPQTATVAYYTIITYYTDGTKINTAVQVTVPNTVCPTASTSYCKDSKTPVECVNFIPIPKTPCDQNPKTGTPTVCSITTDGVAECVPTALCDQCNGLLGMFPDDKKTITEGQLNVACEDLDTCYRDKTDTTVEAYLSCSKPNSCFDYRTQTACETNRCDMPGTCKWNTTTNICAPLNTNFADCKLCTVANGCSETMCNSIPGCAYYEERDNQPLNKADFGSGCYKKEDIPCELYVSKQQCEGTSVFDMDVTYTAGKRVSGTNTVKTKSGDLYAHGKCVWKAQQNVCVRDADKDNTADQVSIQAQLASNEKILPYLLDFTDPVTTVMDLPNKLYAKQFTVNIATTGSKLYAEIKRPGACYPTSTSLVTAQTVSRTFDVAADGGDWQMCYYAEDKSRNLEVVKVFPFKIDVSAPVITVTSTKSIIPYAQGGFRTVVAVSFTVSEPSQCTTVLKKADGTEAQQADTGLQGSGAKTSGYGTKFSVTYPQVVDGTFTTTIECTDSAQNKQTEVHQFTTDTDFDITKPYPVNVQRPYNTTEINISVETARNAQCRYGQRGMSFAQMTPYTTTSALKHNATIRYTTSNPSGDYKLQTACDFAGTIVYGGAADDVMFSIDILPPQITLCDGTKTNAGATSCPNTLFTNTRSSTQKILLICTDDPKTSLNFGCNGMKACNTTVGGSCTPTLITSTPVFDFSGTQPVDFVYESVDKGGNRIGGRRTINLNDMTQPQVTYVFKKE
jgi:hypothetical protein